MATLKFTLHAACTVSQMRQKLARMLARLDGDQEVVFSFNAAVSVHQPATEPTIVYGELARPEND
jgi:hypothetical protein